MSSGSSGTAFFLPTPGVAKVSTTPIECNAAPCLTIPASHTSTTGDTPSVGTPGAVHTTGGIEGRTLMGSSPSCAEIVFNCKFDW